LFGQFTRRSPAVNDYENMPDLRFIERRDKVEIVERLGLFDRGSDLFWREYGWQARVAELHNASRKPQAASQIACHGRRSMCLMAMAARSRRRQTLRAADRLAALETAGALNEKVQETTCSPP
jgi:hypothetical protein